MDINTPLIFGRYKGLTIREVFTGNKNIDKDLLSAYLVWRVEKGDVENVDNEITSNLFNFEIDRNTIKLIPTLPDFNVDSTKSLESFFVSGDSLEAKLVNFSLDAFCYDVYLKPNDPKLVIGGVPEYIVWCIKTINRFFINPDQIEQLEADGVNRFVGINVLYTGEKTYEYTPKVIHEPYKISDWVIKENNRKAPFTGRLWI